jgi:hypothetical protein
MGHTKGERHKARQMTHTRMSSRFHPVRSSRTAAVTAVQDGQASASACGMTVIARKVTETTVCQGK